MRRRCDSFFISECMCLVVAWEVVEGIFYEVKGDYNLVHDIIFEDLLGCAVASAFGWDCTGASFLNELCDDEGVYHSWPFGAPAPEGKAREGKGAHTHSHREGTAEGERFSPCRQLSAAAALPPQNKVGGDSKERRRKEREGMGGGRGHTHTHSHREGKEKMDRGRGTMCCYPHAQGGGGGSATGVQRWHKDSDTSPHLQWVL
jgi:hypothetical protein